MDAFYYSTAIMAGFLFLCSFLRAPKKTCDIRDVQQMIAMALFGIVSVYGLMKLLSN